MMIKNFSKFEAELTTKIILLLKDLKNSKNILDEITIGDIDYMVDEIILLIKKEE